MADSPYLGLAEAKWLQKTNELIEAHPLKTKEIKEVVLQAWDDLFDSKFGPKNFKIGTHIFPKPQIMGFFLHELIPLEFATRYPNKWRGEKTAGDKDAVYIPDNKFSIEIKTSSHAAQIFGNRSYAQVGTTEGKKSKSGYYLTVNFGKFTATECRPKILKIRFGWIDHSDWIGQAAATGQQAHLVAGADRYKLLAIYPAE
ncbi:MAG: ScaI family restriction endonuclease [Terracidiphilus sp.]|nr:ScaI family restriction endonuclease [Terracidiphilus sp.]